MMRVTLSLCYISAGIRALTTLIAAAARVIPVTQTIVGGKSDLPSIKSLLFQEKNKSVIVLLPTIFHKPIAQWSYNSCTNLTSEND